MSAAREALGQLVALGATVEAAGDRLVLRAGPTAVPAGLVSRLRQAKAEVMAVLADVPPLGPGVDDPATWRDFYEERAAIREYAGHYRRDIAERLAYSECIEAWCRCHPQPHDTTICAGCSRPLAGEALDLPDGARVHWERQREFACLITYGELRRRRAVAALAQFGLISPVR